MNAREYAEYRRRRDARTRPETEVAHAVALPSPRGHVCTALIVNGRAAYLRVESAHDRRTHPVATLDAVAEYIAADPRAPDIRPAIKALRELEARLSEGEELRAWMSAPAVRGVAAVACSTSDETNEKENRT